MVGEEPGDVGVLAREVSRLALLERRMEGLLGVGIELAAARTREAVGRIVIDQGVAAIGATYGAIWVRDGDVLHLLAASQLARGNLERWHQIPLDTDAPLPEVVRTNVPAFLHSLAEYEARFPASFERIAPLVVSPDVAYANVPLAGEAGPLGGMTLTFETGAELDTSAKTYLALLARQCAIALERIDLLEAERSSRLALEAAVRAADDATRAREEILAMVSHDLRNPLGTILMGATALLQHASPADAKGQRVRTVATRIKRQSERMARLIDDLVAFAGIQAGRIAITRAEHGPGAILTSIRELFGPIAEERELVLVIDLAADLPVVECDAERCVQILANLAANALKITARGGQITIGARLDGDDDVVFFVRDEGGTDPRAAGIGLSIAHGLVAAHGGRLWTESPPDGGATFAFCLVPAG